MDTLHNDVFNAIADLTRLSSDLVVQEAIYLDKPVQTARRLTKRIVKGDMVRIDVDNVNGACLIDCMDAFGPTHVILECLGTIYSGDLQVICEDLDTQELITVKL